jgi:cytidylate kinase
MVIGIIGESCTGKTTLAEKLKCEIDAEVFSGKDYLSFAKSEVAAKEAFQNKLQEAMTSGNVIYVISEKEHLALLPKGALRVLVTAELSVIKERFAARMHGNLPAPVSLMLEKKHGCFDATAHDVHIVSGETDLGYSCAQIVRLKEKVV